MHWNRITGAIAIGTLTAIAGAQTTFMNDTHPWIVPIPSGMTVLALGATASDAEYNIVTTVGNPLFPAGSVRIANDGVALAGITAGDVTPLNSSIAPTGFPAGVPPGAAAVCAFWDDLIPGDFLTAHLLWTEVDGVLHILWLNQARCCPVSGGTVTFAIQVFAAPAPGDPWIQIVYFDTAFGAGPVPGNSGDSATIGYVGGPSSIGTNVQWSFNTPSVLAPSVLSIFHEMTVAPSSPSGPGSLLLALSTGPANGTYFLAATSTPGAFPNGWFFGLDISYADLVAEITAGFPFTGPLGPTGGFGIGPFTGLPPITLCAVALGFAPGSTVPNVVSPAISYAIP